MRDSESLERSRNHPSSRKTRRKPAHQTCRGRAWNALLPAGVACPRMSAMDRQDGTHFCHFRIQVDSRSCST